MAEASLVVHGARDPVSGAGHLAPGTGTMKEDTCSQTN